MTPEGNTLSMEVYCQQNRYFWKHKIHYRSAEKQK